MKADEPPDRSRRSSARTGLRFADREAVVDGEQRPTYLQLAEHAVQATRAVMAAGKHAGDRVAIWAPNSVAIIVAALGILGAGAWLVPINTHSARATKRRTC
jgi:HIP---CoA ligase